MKHVNWQELILLKINVSRSSYVYLFRPYYKIHRHLSNRGYMHVQNLKKLYISIRFTCTLNMYTQVLFETLGLL